MCPRRMQDATAQVPGLEAGHLEWEEIVVEDRGQVHFLTAVSEPVPDSRSARRSAVVAALRLAT